MTSTNAATADPPRLKGGDSARERREAKSRRRRNVRVAVAVTIALVLAMIGGAVTWYLASEAGGLEAQNATAKSLLAASDGKVAEQSTRVALSSQISLVDTMLEDPFFTRLPAETAAARQPLAAATDAVQASMVEYGRGEVAAARKALKTTEVRATKVYAATEGKGVDDGVRARLRSALDTVTAADAAAETSVAGEDLAELEKAVLDLSTNRSGVSAATDALAAAQDEITCPAPDQVWDPDSGLLQPELLSEIPWAPSYFVRSDVLDGLIDLDKAFYEAFGVHLTINSAYRTYDEQKELYDPSSPIAAAPGCSNHGLGLAVDIGGGVQTFDTEPYNWLKANAGTYGWVHPAFAEPNGRVPEPWHWQSVKARESS